MILKSNLSKVRVRLRKAKADFDRKEKLLKRQKLRNNEYYDMQTVFDRLYADSLAECEFQNLIDIITTEENIRLAYRNLKKNAGSKRRGQMEKPSGTWRN